MQIRCRSKSDLSSYHTIKIIGHGDVTCCGRGEFFCSHIDAVINYGLKTVVHFEDQHLVDEARKIAGIISPPDAWKSTWLRDTSWINGQVERTARPSRGSKKIRDTDKPGVCFSGKNPQFERSELAKEAELIGWSYTRDINQLTQILVLADKSSNSKKAKAARSQGVVIVDYAEWRDILPTPCWTKG